MADTSLVTRSTLLAMHINPRFIGSLHHAVELHINSLLLKYNASLEGVPIAVGSFRTLSSKALVNSDFPLLHFEAGARFTVFAPQVGSTLLGQVNHVSSDHVGMLVMGVFNASIASTNMKEGYSFDEAGYSWTDGQRSILTPGSFVQFVVTSFDIADDVFSIHGSITESSAGFEEGLCKICIPNRSFLEQARRSGGGVREPG